MTTATVICLVLCSLLSIQLVPDSGVLCHSNKTKKPRSNAPLSLKPSLILLLPLLPPPLWCGYLGVAASTTRLGAPPGSSSLICPVPEVSPRPVPRPPGKICSWSEWLTLWPCPDPLSLSFLWCTLFQGMVLSLIQPLKLRNLNHTLLPLLNPPSNQSSGAVGSLS